MRFCLKNMQKTNFNIKNKVCIITGGVGLIGSGFSRQCAEQGARVVIADVNPEKGKSLVKELINDTGNKQIIFQKCDVTSELSVKNMVKMVVKKFGRIDALINSAYPRNKHWGRKFEQVTYGDFIDSVGMHTGGYFLTTREVSAVMAKQKSGTIILLGSTYGVVAPKFEIYEGTPMTSQVEYAVIKGGIIMLTKYLASYLGPSGIRVNAISPGGVFDNHKDPFLSNYLSKVRLAPRRMARPNDIANAALFLISDSSEYITGQNIIVDGGWTI